MKDLVGFFDEYVQCGLQPIAIYKGDKCPIGKLWNQNWSVQRWRPMFEQTNDLNMGILLGNIVDVEGDTDQANENLSDMIGDLPHPMFKSSKSIHHIFLNPDENLTRKVMNGIGLIRTNRLFRLLPIILETNTNGYQIINYQYRKCHVFFTNIIFQI